MTGKEEFRRQLNLLNDLSEENPCGLPDVVYHAFASGLRNFIGGNVDTTMSMDSVAKYFGVSARTIRRWMEERDFPQPHRHGFQKKAFNAVEIMEWKKKNKDLFC